MQRFNDETIKKALKGKIYIPNSYINAIDTAFNTKQKRIDFIKILATSCVGIILTGGVVSAGYNIYQKIWKEPIYMTEEKQQEEVSNVMSDIPEEETNGFINKDKVNKIALSILQKLNYDDENISETILQKGYNNTITYLIKTESKKLITINPETGELNNFIDNSIFTQKINSDEINKEKAIQVAKDTYSKLGINLIDNGYEVFKTEENKYVSNENSNKMWNVKFAKKYNNTFDQEDYYSLTFFINNNKTYYYAISGNIKGNFENNPIIITKEEAINIAKQKEKSFSSLDISEINANLSIEKMNLFVWGLENNIDNNDGKYKIEDKSRNVWIVTIRHNVENAMRNYDIQSIKENYDKKYYIDATTGEIIGGNQAELEIQ